MTPDREDENPERGNETMKTHTPGPWSCDYGDSAVFCDTGAEIASVTHGNHDDSTAIGCAETICNLKLIAAAPDLLDALAVIVGIAELDCMDDRSNVWRTALIDARAAIAKAEGRA